MNSTACRSLKPKASFVAPAGELPAGEASRVQQLARALRADLRFDRLLELDQRFGPDEQIAHLFEEQRAGVRVPE